MSIAKPFWNIGDRLEEKELPPVSRLQLIKYAGASGDYNPIHLLDEAAEEAGLPGVIAHGMFSVAAITRLFSPYLEHGYVKELNARFSGIVLIGDALAVGGRATAVQETEEGHLHSFQVYARRGGDTVVSGTAAFLVYGD